MQQIGGKYKGASQSDLLRIRKERILFQTYDPYNRKIAQTVPVTTQVVFQSALNTLEQITQQDSSAIPLFTYGFSELFQVVTARAFILQALILTTTNLNPVEFNFGTHPMLILYPIPQQLGGGLIVTDAPTDYFVYGGKHSLYISNLPNVSGFELKNYKGTVSIPPIPTLKILTLMCGTGGKGPTGLGDAVADPSRLTNLDFRGFVNLEEAIVNYIDFAAGSPIVNCAQMAFLQSLSLTGIGTPFSLNLSGCVSLTSLNLSFSKITTLTVNDPCPLLSEIDTYGSNITGTTLDNLVAVLTGKVAASGTWTSDQDQPVPFLVGWTWFKPPPSVIGVEDGGETAITAAQVAGYTRFSVTVVGCGGKGGVGGGGGGGAYMTVSGLLSQLSFPLSLKAGKFSDIASDTLSYLLDSEGGIVAQAGAGSPGTASQPGTGGVPYQAMSTSAPGQNGTPSAGGKSGAFPLGLYTDYGTGGNPPNEIAQKGGVAVFTFS